jgi:hypothetical protein
VLCKHRKHVCVVGRGRRQSVRHVCVSAPVGRLLEGCRAQGCAFSTVNWLPEDVQKRIVSCVWDPAGTRIVECVCSAHPSQYASRTQVRETTSLRTGCVLAWTCTMSIVRTHVYVFLVRVQSSTHPVRKEAVSRTCRVRVRTLNQKLSRFGLVEMQSINQYDAC